MPGVGHGLPYWLPDRFLVVSEVLALDPWDLRFSDDVCPVCNQWSRELDPAHIVNKGMGGRPDGAGPTVRICRTCHDGLHFGKDSANRTLAVRDDGAVCFVRRDVAAQVFKVKVLGRLPHWGREGGTA